MHSIWKQLKRPYTILAPMDDVTDTVFREIVTRAATPDLLFTEFASTDGFMHTGGRPGVERRLRINPSEAKLGVPIIAQIWGNNPDNYYAMAQDIASRNQFAGIDINMGCPEKGIVRRGCCGGLIKEENWDNAAAIIAATKAGADTLPVSVKTRIGVNRIVTKEWVSYLLHQDIAALTIHGRTVKEMSKVPAHWDEISKAVAVRDQISPDTPIIGNGDVENRTHGEELAETYGLDGIMIGRGIFHDIRAFAHNLPELTPDDRLSLLLEHMDLYQTTWEGTKPYDPMKKFCKLYISGYPGAAEARAQLMETRSIDEARQLIRQLQESIPAS